MCVRACWVLFCTRILFRNNNLLSPSVVCLILRCAAIATRKHEVRLCRLGRRCSRRFANIFLSHTPSSTLLFSFRPHGVIDLHNMRTLEAEKSSRLLSVSNRTNLVQHFLNLKLLIHSFSPSRRGCGLRAGRYALASRIEGTLHVCCGTPPPLSLACSLARPSPSSAYIPNTECNPQTATKTQAPPPAKLALPKAKLEAAAVNAKQWGIGSAAAAPAAAPAATSPAAAATDETFNPRSLLRTPWTSGSGKQVAEPAPAPAAAASSSVSAILSLLR